MAEIGPLEGQTIQSGTGSRVAVTRSNRGITCDGESESGRHLAYVQSGNGRSTASPLSRPFGRQIVAADVMSGVRLGIASRRAKS